MPDFYYIVLKTEVNVDFNNMDCSCFCSTDCKYLNRYADSFYNYLHVNFVPFKNLLFFLCLKIITLAISQFSFQQSQIPKIEVLKIFTSSFPFAPYIQVKRDPELQLLCVRSPLHPHMPEGRGSLNSQCSGKTPPPPPLLHSSKERLTSIINFETIRTNL